MKGGEMRERVPVNKEETAEDRLLNFVEEQTNKFTKYPRWLTVAVVLLTLR